MGEVYRARDTELDRTVALKVLPEDVAADPDRLKRFEREARATAALSHPNVLTVFDVGRENGRAYLVFELLEGSTLGTRLARGPLPTDEALGYAVQIARGLAAAHARGIVHRDLKPDNLFLTTAGVVKVLDFGLARVQPSGERNTTASDVTGPGAVMGTVSYMSPEQAKGHPGDARSDIFALGTVLYEMLSGKHPFRRDSSAETLTAILRDEPQDLGTLADEVPAAVVRLVRRCLEKKPEDRFQTANDLALALEAVDESQDRHDRPAAAEPAEERPYPGLSSFVEADAARFFGREAEIGAIWEKVRRQSLLALIGPSGAGKTSFLRAGVIPQRPAGWNAVYMTPGASPLAGLARPLAPQLVADPEALTELVEGLTEATDSGGGDRVVTALARWKQRTGEALLVVDQFEELFTLSSEESQARFAALLGRATAEAGVHILLSLRDDFLFRCHSFAVPGRVFHDLTPLGPPSPEALRRALVEPAARLGVRFEDDALVAEMVATVDKERGALPLLAFAISRLWEEQDRERRLLTRADYERIGGVAGALAQHAEATLQRIGPAREGLVREIFRNLVTAEGTRAARERNELLSVFAAPRFERPQGEAVLDALVASRLLTEYEAPGAAPSAIEPRTASAGTSGGSARIEIVHESLLTHWPRLERWLAQDAEGALLRDQLRQAARLWDGKGRPEELLWTGRSYREYAVWRERYSGGLSSVEEDFARAMSLLAGRRRRRRRMAAAAALATALAVATGAVVLWSRAEKARQAATEETRQREAAQLLALGRAQLAEEPAEALAFAIASLERADNAPARRFAVEALWHGASVFRIAQDQDPWAMVFSPDGRWAATTGMKGVFLWSRDGGAPKRIAPPEGPIIWAEFVGRDGNMLATWGWQPSYSVRIWSVPEGKLLRTMPFEHTVVWGAGPDLLSVSRLAAPPSSESKVSVIRRWPLEGGEPRVLGRVDLRGVPGGERDPYPNDSNEHWSLGVEPDRVHELRQGAVYTRSLETPTAFPPIVRRYPTDDGLFLHPSGRWLHSAARSGALRLWSLDPEAPMRPFELRGAESSESMGLDPSAFPVEVDAAGRQVSGRGSTGRLLWDLTGPPDAQPQRLRTRAGDFGFRALLQSGWRLADRGAEKPSGSLAHPPRRSYAFRLPKGHYASFVTMSPDGRFVASVSSNESKGEVRLWPLTASAGESGRRLWSDPRLQGGEIHFDPTGRFLIGNLKYAGQIFVLPVDGSKPRLLEGNGTWDEVIALDREGRHVASAFTDLKRKTTHIRVFDLATGAFRDIDPRVNGDDCLTEGAFQYYVQQVRFLPDGRLLAETLSGLRLFDVEPGTSRVLRAKTKSECRMWDVTPSPDGRTLAELGAPGTVGIGLSPLEGGPRREITTHGSDVWPVAFDPSGSSSSPETEPASSGWVPTTGEEPHLLYGHEKLIQQPRRLSRRAVDRLVLGRRNDPPVADAQGPTVPHAPLRPASREAPRAHEPARRGRREVPDGLQDRGRSLPGLGQGTGVVTRRFSGGSFPQRGRRPASTSREARVRRRRFHRGAGRVARRGGPLRTTGPPRRARRRRPTPHGCRRRNSRHASGPCASPRPARNPLRSGPRPRRRAHRQGTCPQTVGPHGRRHPD